MSLIILKQGALDTFQDGGRYGYSAWGINPGGNMDSYASQVANALVGNELNAVVLEMHFPACTVQFGETMLITLTGADFSASVNDRKIPMWKPVLIRKDSTLIFNKKIKGMRCYLSVRGEFDIEPWLKSKSTNLKIQGGGFEGRRLLKQDVIPARNNFYSKRQIIENVIVLPWAVNPKSVYENPNSLLFTSGNEWNWFTDESKKRLENSSFIIARSSDRMGYYLENEPLNYRFREELLSSAVTFGAIQGLPNGKLIVLMADHQTTGGYPQIGYVVSSDLPKLSQLGPDENVSFQKTTHEEAEKMIISRQHEIRLIQQSCSNKLIEFNADN